MPLRFLLDPPIGDALRESVTQLWSEVASSGGPVDFAGPVTRAEVESLADSCLSGVVDGYDHLLAGFVGDKLVAMLFFVSQRLNIQEHWRTVKRVMVHPGAQGRGYGAALMREGERVARDQGWEALHLSVRAGSGLDRFYTRLGYQVVGRFPGALRLAQGENLDEIHMWLPLSPPQVHSRLAAPRR